MKRPRIPLELAERAVGGYSTSITNHRQTQCHLLGVTVRGHKIIVSNYPDDELSSARNIIA
jgi:hypothetical protein